VWLEFVDGTANDASFGRFDEIENEVALLAGGVVGFDGAQGIGVVESARVECSVDVLDEENLLVGEATSPQSDDVDTTIDDRVSPDKSIGGYVFADACAALNHDVLGDAGELVDKAAAADDGEVVDFDFTGELGSIAEDDVVFEDAVVGDMTVSHDEAVAADESASFGGGSAVDGYAFTNGGVWTYFGGGSFAGEFEVLRYACNNSARENEAVVAYSGAVENDSVGEDVGVVADGYVLFDDGKGVNADVVTDLCLWMDNG